MKSKARLLIAEDELIVALDLKQELQGLGYDVVATVSSGEEAVKIATEVVPDLVMMDIHLAGEMDGVEAASAIAEQVDVPVLYVTAYADENTLARAKITQPYGYVIKPVDPRELHIAVEISLQLHRTHKRLAKSEAMVRRQAEQVAEALVKLEQLEELKDQFVRNASHELRTPLALVLGYAEMLAMGDFGELSPEQQRAVDVISRRTNELHLMIEDMNLLLEAEHAGLTPEYIDVSLMLNRILAEYHSKARLAGLTFSAEIDPELPPIKANPVQLYRVIGHLLSNAIKFTPSGGSVLLSGNHINGYVEIEVADTGLGIPQEEQERIFQRFYQVDGSTTRRYPGMGLGLALVKETVDSIGGKVTVRSECGCGSSFKVLLPAQKAGSPFDDRFAAPKWSEWETESGSACAEGRRRK